MLQRVLDRENEVPGVLQGDMISLIYKILSLTYIVSRTYMLSCTYNIPSRTALMERCADLLYYFVSSETIE